MSENNVKTNKPTDLSDGVYIIDMGDGWIFGESSVVSSQILNPKETGTFLQALTKSKETSISVSISVSFTTQFIQASVEYGFGITIGEENTIERSVATTAGDNEYVYFKVYATYRKYNVKRVAHNILTDDGSIYKLTGIWLSKSSGKSLAEIDQGSLIETKERCILPRPPKEILMEILDLSASSELLNLTDSLNYNPFGNLYNWISKDTYTWDKKVNLYITISENNKKYRIVASANTDLILYSNNFNNLKKLKVSLGDNIKSNYFDVSLNAGQYVLVVQPNSYYVGKYYYDIIFQKF